jgi:ABC-type Fe3+ transport system permease subunit
VSTLDVAVVAVVLIVACVAAFLADRALNAAVGGSYALMQNAWRRRGHRLFWMALAAAVILAVGATALALLANG